MMSPNLQFLLIISTLLKIVASVDIECDFKSDDFDTITNQYTCDVQNNLMINTKNVVIKMFRGSYKFGKTSNDVTGLSINDKKVQFMPQSLGEKFKNLVALKVRQGRLKEVSQADLRTFSKLRYLNLDANDIEALDDDLFDFNRQLEIIWFEGNRIKNIGMSVFGNLRNLNDLDLNGNVCMSKRMSNSRGMAEFLKEVNKNCFDAGVELVKFKQKFKSVETVGNVSTSSHDAQMLISNKDTEIEELKVVVQNLTELMKTKDKEADEKFSKIQQKSKENDQKLGKFEAKLTNLTSDIDKLTQQLTKCQNKLEETQLESSNSTAATTSKITQLESQLTDLQVTYLKTQEKCENLSMENQRLNESLSSNSSTYLSLKYTNQESMPDENEEKLKEFEELDSQLKKRETDLKNFEMEVARTMSALIKSKERIEKVLKHKTQEIVKKDAEMKKLKAANAQLQSKNAQLQDELREAKLRMTSLERVVKAEIVSLEELNRTREMLIEETIKLQELEVKFNATMENKTIECLVQKELESSNQVRQGLDSANGNEEVSVQKCPEQLKAIQSTMTMKNNRIKALQMDNNQLKSEKLTIIARQGKLKETINNKTLEWSQEVERSKDLEKLIINNEAAINELLIEKSQLKNEINILTDSEVRLKNSLSNKYSSCYNNIEKLNQDLKNCSHTEQNLRTNIAGFENIIKNNNSTITSLTNELNYVKNQTLISNKPIKCSNNQQELQNCTKIADELRQKVLILEDTMNNQNHNDYTYDED